MCFSLMHYVIVFHFYSLSIGLIPYLFISFLTKRFYWLVFAIKWENLYKKWCRILVLSVSVDSVDLLEVSNIELFICLNCTKAEIFTDFSKWSAESRQSKDSKSTWLILGPAIHLMILEDYFAHCHEQWGACEHSRGLSAYQLLTQHICPVLYFGFITTNMTFYGF